MVDSGAARERDGTTNGEDGFRGSSLAVHSFRVGFF